ncbi:MAG: 3-deoxy-D-manno-octulosonic acid transferase [Desulfuromonadales bacterium]|nr:3-deoxy-D-manno-octulosonic acid transferase [Desulfuromonadales bacterium]
MVYLLYDVVALLIGVLLVPYYLLRGVRYGKTRRGIRERLGFYDEARLRKVRNQRVIWVHAVSVGETRAALPLLKALKQEFPRHTLLLTGVTETGRAVADEIDCVDLTIFFPFDLSWVVSRALRLINPALVIIVETELWPNFVRLAHRRKIPLILVNGRISDRSFPRYRRARLLVAPVMQKVTRFAMQSPTDAERVQILGAAAPKVTVSGNLKFDIQGQGAADYRLDQVREEFHLPENLVVWAAGSTHPGEEEMVVDVYQQLLSARPELVLLLVPRHPERTRSVAANLRKRGLSCRLRSELTAHSTPLRAGEILLIDTLGEMLKIYALAEVVFVGGSLVAIGGHNVLEAALMGKVAVFGPYMQNFREISEKVMACRAGVQVNDVEELFTQTLVLLNDPDLRSEMGRAGAKLIAANAGATARTMQVVREVLRY